MPGRSKYSWALSLKSSAVAGSADTATRKHIEQINPRILIPLIPAPSRAAAMVGTVLRVNQSGGGHHARLGRGPPRRHDFVDEAQLFQHRSGEHEGVRVLHAHAAIEAVQRQGHGI